MFAVWLVKTLLRYDTIQEFNMDSKAECGHLNLAHVARNIIIKQSKSININTCVCAYIQF